MFSNWPKAGLKKKKKKNVVTFKPTTHTLNIEDRKFFFYLWFFSMSFVRVFVSVFGLCMSCLTLL